MNGANKKSEAELDQLCQAFLFNLQFIKVRRNFEAVLSALSGVQATFQVGQYPRSWQRSLFTS